MEYDRFFFFPFQKNEDDRDDNFEDDDNNKINTAPFCSPDQPDLKFELLQLYTLVSIETDIEQYNSSIPGQKIAYKGIIVGNNIMTTPPGVFKDEL